MKWYLFCSESGDAWRNMARDEWFLEHIQPDEMVLFLYTNRPSVIIGKNQNPWKECNLPAMEQDGVRLARRVSGGGAVFHDEGNLNFSFLTGAAHYDLSRQLGVILSAVRSLGIEACFSGRNDITAGGRKFSGNAFCMRRGNRMHHGTLLLYADLGRLQRYLSASPLKLQSKGIDSVRARVCNLCELNPLLARPDASQRMADALRAAFQAEYGAAAPYPMSPDAKSQVEALYQKHASWEWRMGAAPSFDMELEHRFSWGGVEFCLSLKNSQISALTVFTDALDTELSARLEALLLGCRLDRQEIAGRLRSAAGEPDPVLGEIADYWDTLAL